jgi:hypothetical protein
LDLAALVAMVEYPQFQELLKPTQVAELEVVIMALNLVVLAVAELVGG